MVTMNRLYMQSDYSYPFTSSDGVKTNPKDFDVILN